MANWRVEFEVTHKYLADAQESLYALKGVSNMHLRPIKETSPREHANGKASSIAGLINSRPDIVFTTTDVAKAVGDSSKLVGQRLAYLVTAKRIRRVGSGKFKALSARAK